MRLRSFVFIAPLFLFSSCFMIKPVAVNKVENFRADLKLEKPGVLFDVGVSNPNGFGITLRSMGVNLSLGEKSIAGLSIIEKARISSKSQTSIPIVLNPSVADIAAMASSGLGDLFGGKKKPLVIEGEIVVSKFIFKRKIKFRESVNF